MTTANKSDDLPASGNQDDKIEPVMTCFRCGVCCTKYQVRLDLAEARQITKKLGITRAEWLKTYTDKRWPGRNSLLICRKDNGDCVFLERLSNKLTNCLLHSIKPRLCREWEASPAKRECQEGLLNCWGLTISDAGKITGPPDKIAEFGIFLSTLDQQK